MKADQTAVYHISAEAKRLAFVEQRDGLEKAIEFAARTLYVYRKVIRRTPSGKKQFPHDKKFIASYYYSIIFLRRYLKKHNPDRKKLHDLV